MSQTTVDLPDADASFYPKKSGRSSSKWLILVVLALLIGGGVWYYLKNKPAAGPTQFRTATVARGDIVARHK